MEAQVLSLLTFTSTKGGEKGKAHANGSSGNQFTYFTRTKVQILTLLLEISALMEAHRYSKASKKTSKLSTYFRAVTSQKPFHTQFTYFSGTKVQILTRLLEIASQNGTVPSQKPLSILVLLVQKYKY